MSIKNLAGLVALLSGAQFLEAAAADAAPSTGSSTAKPKAEAEKVTMDDGRTVEFAGKRKMLKDTLVPGVTENYTGPLAVRFDFRSGKTLTYTLNDKLTAQFAAHGASQKIGDEAAGEDDVDDMYLAIEAISKRLTGDSPEWNVKREGGGFAGVSVLLKALVELKHQRRAERGEPAISDETAVAEVKELLSKMTQPEKMALRASALLKPIIDRLESEKAAKAAKVDTAALLANI